MHNRMNFQSEEETIEISELAKFQCHEITANLLKQMKTR